MQQRPAWGPDRSFLLASVGVGLIGRLTGIKEATLDNGSLISPEFFLCSRVKEGWPKQYGFTLLLEFVHAF